MIAVDGITGTCGSCGGAVYASRTSLTKYSSRCLACGAIPRDLYGAMLPMKPSEKPADPLAGEYYDVITRRFGTKEQIAADPDAKALREYRKMVINQISGAAALLAEGGK